VKIHENHQVLKGGLGRDEKRWSGKRKNEVERRRNELNSDGVDER
jgi:hypothetical protein